jgi:CheY-specific phosphatase CheX
MNTATPHTIDDVGHLLKSSAHEVFATVFETRANPIDHFELRKINTTLIIGSVSLVGELNGTINLYIKPAFARNLASRMLGRPEDQFDGDDGDELIDDVVGELSNMIVGAAKCRLNDSGTPCTSTLPRVNRENSFRSKPSGRGEERYISLACEDQIIMLQIILLPAGQPNSIPSL